MSGTNGDCSCFYVFSSISVQVWQPSVSAKKEDTVLIVSAKFTYCSPASIFDVTLKQKNALETGCKGTRKHFVSLLDKILELG